MGAKRTRRIGYWKDPEAPEPTSRRTSASVFARDEAGRLLLLRRVDNDLWTIPAGGVTRGETVGEADVRECREGRTTAVAAQRPRFPRRAGSGAVCCCQKAGSSSSGGGGGTTAGVHMPFSSSAMWSSLTLRTRTPGSSSKRSRVSAMAAVRVSARTTQRKPA
ncbi:NUDIX domain-containing protein [Streptomyces clavuligerus]|uniref:Putative mutT-like protein n=1 Tax=Streptomyces clavuligerus TaxID=1901 RepID=E2Q0Z5_STRCL|nr:NUDIX domain-containing protein [Streptomyces clavuligerus]EFG06538.1 Putative mutT-like protein [Streptomyces clavuligerus]MBY6305174.1 NUDIX domain-containing protein [Streptomyces clavuligerus]QCS07884.1 NUDIX domain-containing protein [Streptomyces clavuligerus]QPJ92776.1 NUDIX domain-containing protein [Streptomyces clavuligerus]